MEVPKSTVDNSFEWRMWHSINYASGGITFLVGSILLFPFFGGYIDYFDAARISAWLYTVGSTNFLLADVTEWIHFTYTDCRFFILSLNFFVSVCGSFLYLIGSACFIPELNASDEGLVLFIYGSSFIVVGQIWKLGRSINQEGLTIKECIKEDFKGFMVDTFAGLGGLMYLIGSFFFQKSSEVPQYLNIGASIFSCGGFFFLLSGLFILARYFNHEKTEDRKYYSAESQGILTN